MSNQPKPVGRADARPTSHNNPDMLELVERTKKPGRHYRWVRCRADENGKSVANHKRKGYIPEKQEEGGVKTMVEPDQRLDGVIAIGDMILMSCPIHLHQQRVAERSRLTNAKMNSAAAQTKQMAKAKGVRLIQDEGEDTETQVT